MDGLLAAMPAGLMAEWQAYCHLDPFGNERQDLQAGIVASTVANCMGREKGRKAFEPDEFMPSWDNRKRRTTRELMTLAQIMVARCGGVIRSGEHRVDGLSTGPQPRGVHEGP